MKERTKTSTNIEQHHNEGMNVIIFVNDNQGITISYDPYYEVFYINGYEPRGYLVLGGEIRLEDFLEKLGVEL